MDNLTHSLVGLMLSRAGLNRGEKGTAAMIVVAANIPDVDGYPFFYDPLRYLQVHRGYAHALVFAPGMAILAIVVVKLAEKVIERLRARGYTWNAFLAKANLQNASVRRGIATKTHRDYTTGSYFYLWFACTLAVLSHLALDWTNVYGIRMLLPFSDRWLRLDTVNLFDGIIWIILAIAVGAPGIARLVNSEIGSKQSGGPKRVWACLALIGLFGYEVFRYNSHKDVIAVLDSREYRGSPADAISAFPDSFGTLKWRGLVEANEVYFEIPVLYNGYYNFDINSAQREYKTGESKAIDSARKTRAFQIFEEFDQAPLWHLSPIGNEMKVELFDMRFGTFKRPGFTATANIAEDGHVIDSGFSFGR